jgi:hypothetical protein
MQEQEQQRNYLPSMEQFHRSLEENSWFQMKKKKEALEHED